ncbi:MAG: tRNA preQ1(34) S-adenosylmethionine ribosyltransferase-isomerase QueA [Hyphomicrobiales bacterium]|nr:tRNA preQ1(34) S-adenosylmethionine ribosyltransferase-isomerase QueA [Hyphomicrobiales bacterium]
MDVELFDFVLPEENVALRPAVPRDSSRLLVVKPDNGFEDRDFGELAEYLRPGDGLVFNDTRVIPAQFEALRERDGNIARIGLTLHRRKSAHQWAAFARGAKKLKVGERLCLTRSGNSTGGGGLACLAGVLEAVVSQKSEGGEIELDFDLSGPVLDEVMMANGEMPLPPYIASKRLQDDRDLVDYQTIYAANDGAVAAPTAGLHFSDEIFSKLDGIGVTRHFCTLHVGAGTFLPVKADDTVDHKMHFENGIISEETANQLNAIRARGGRIVSVGTTSLRLLESAIEPDGKFRQWQGATDIFITPGYKFRATDLLITNFHLPRSTLFMLVSAFSGLDIMKNAYSHAIQNSYRFYSYGDSSLLYPGANN